MILHFTILHYKVMLFVFFPNSTAGLVQPTLTISMLRVRVAGSGWWFLFGIAGPPRPFACFEFGGCRCRFKAKLKLMTL